MSTTLRFKATIQIMGINPYVLVGVDKVNKLQRDWRRPMPVVIRVDGQPELPWHINMMPVGNGDFYLYLHKNVRQASQSKVGDEVTIEMSFDQAYRNGPIHEMSLQFRLALDQNPTAAIHWRELSPSRQKEVLRYFSSLKSELAIDRNILRAIKVLEGNSGRFMARDWLNGK
jgi:hypothetical protein